MEIVSPIHKNQQPSIIIDTRPSYEFLISLQVFSDFADAQTYEIGKSWYDNVHAKLTSETLSAIEKLGIYGCEGWTYLLGLAYDCPAPGDVSSFIDYIESLEALELRLRLAGYYLRRVRRITSPEVIVRAVQGDTNAQKQFLKTACFDKPIYQKRLRQFLTLGVEETKTLMLSVMYEWQQKIFSEEELRVMPILRCDVESKRVLQQVVDPERFIEVATNGYEYVPEPFVRQIVLIPSYHLRPYIQNIEHHDVSIFCYSVSEESLNADQDTPPAQLVNLYKALADERRLRILRKVSTRSATLQELADEFGVAKSTMHHHLVLLRVAGLLRLRSSDGRYSLRQDIIPNISELLEAYLNR